jgi:hypothetical protein
MLVDMDRVFPVVQLIMNEWSRTNCFQYVIRSDTPLIGVPIDEIRDAQVWVGVGASVQLLTLCEATVAFKWIADQAAKMKKAPRDQPIREIASVLRLEPTDDDIRWLLRNAKIDEAV